MFHEWMSAVSAHTQTVLLFILENLNASKTQQPNMYCKLLLVFLQQLNKQEVELELLVNASNKYFPL